VSVRIMSAVWQYGPADSMDRLVLLAIADNANDDGVAWPAVRRLADKCCIGERGMRYRLRKLEEEGWIVTGAGEGMSGTNRYTIRPERLKQGHSRAGGHDSAGGTAVQEGGAQERMKGGHSRAANPSEEPSLNHQSANPGSRSAMTEAWQPNKKHRTHASELGLDLEEQLAQFRGYWMQHEGSRKSAGGWNRAFTNWMNNGVKFAGRSGKGRPTTYDEAWDADPELGRWLNGMLAQSRRAESAEERDEQIKGWIAEWYDAGAESASG
jgi:hypothetical protein